MSYVVLVCGSRSIQQSEIIPKIVSNLIKSNAEIIVGDAPGVDRLVVYEAVRQNYGQCVTVVGAYGKCRNTYCIGKVKGIITLSTTYLARNLYMIGLANECIAIWDGYSRGTKFTFESAQKAGLPVKVYTEGR